MPLPLSDTDLPEKLRRFASASAPTPAKTMAAKGLVPVRGLDLVTLLVQLAADEDPGVATAARSTLGGLPESVLAAGCVAPLHPDILDGLIEVVSGPGPLLGELVANRDLPVRSVVRVAETAEELICERIATDQVRLLESPEIIEALYRNPKARPSTIDRLVELAARNGVRLDGIASFDAHVEAIQGQLIVDEPTDEPLPDDLVFAEALAHDDDDDAVERDKVDGTEEVAKKHKPLATMVADMNIAQKVRLATIGNAAARSLLVRDSNKTVAKAAISSPAMTDAEAARVAVSKQIDEDILRFIGNRREWLSNYEVKRNLVFNPKTPVATSMKFMSHLRANDLRTLARSKNVPSAIRASATARLQKKGN